MPSHPDQHDQRVRRMLILSSHATVCVALGWALYFASRSDWLVTSFDLAIAATAGGAYVLGRQHRSRAATFVMLALMYVGIFLSSAFLDIPTPEIPRGMHEFFLSLGVGSMLTLRKERPWIRQVFPIACLVAYAFFNGVNPAWRTEYVTPAPEAARSVGVWIDRLVALAMLYLVVRVIQNDSVRRGAQESELRDALLHDEFELHFQPQVDADGRVFAPRA